MVPCVKRRSTTRIGWAYWPGLRFVVKVNVVDVDPLRP